MTAVIFIPLCHRRILVHVLNDVPPSDARVVSTEGDFTLLSSVRDDAHLGATEVVVEKILEPHAGDEQEIPAVGTTLLDVIRRTVAGNFAIVFAGQTKRLVKLLEELIKRKL